MIDYKISNNKEFRYIFVITDNYSKFLWAIPLKNNNSKTITDEFSNVLSSSKRKLLKIASDRGTEFYNIIFQNFLKSKNIHHYSRFTDEGPSKTERVIRTIHNIIKKPVFLAGNADWLNERSAVVNKYNNTVHSSTKMTPNQAIKKSNERKVYSNLQYRIVNQQPKFKLGQLVRTADIKRVFSNGDSTNYGYILNTKNEVIKDTVPRYRINYLPEK